MSDMQTTATPETETATLPVLACPNCGANLLATGFYNSCTETQRLREDNTTYLLNGRLCIDDEEKDYETVNHECDTEAFCASCNKELPWALYEIRGLDGELLADVEPMIADLLAQLEPLTTEGAAAQA